MNRDRGNVKWTAMMLPEHVKMLREWKKEDEYIPKPELDEWTLQELGERLQIAYERQLEVELEVWEEKKKYKVTGTIERVNSSELYLKDGRYLPINSIYGISYIV